MRHLSISRLALYNECVKTYRKKLQALLSPEEHKLFKKLSSPTKIQDYLDALPINFELSGETLMSPRRLIQEQKAHCIEGALFAAAALAYHGELPLLLDLQTIEDDEDHVVTLFKKNNLWGAISKTNHAILRYRDPVYESVRELAMSYFHEYMMIDGKKTLRAFSAPYDLRQYAPEKWVTPMEDMEWMAEELDASKHFPAVPKNMIRSLRKATRIEIRTLDFTEWTEKGVKKKL